MTESANAGPVEAHPLMPGLAPGQHRYLTPPEPPAGTWIAQVDPGDPTSWPTMGLPDDVGANIGAWARRPDPE